MRVRIERWRRQELLVIIPVIFLILLMLPRNIWPW